MPLCVAFFSKSRLDYVGRDNMMNSMVCRYVLWKTLRGHQKSGKIAPQIRSRPLTSKFQDNGKTGELLSKSLTFCFMEYKVTVLDKPTFFVRILKIRDNFMQRASLFDVWFKGNVLTRTQINSYPSQLVPTNSSLYEHVPWSTHTLMN